MFARAIKIASVVLWLLGLIGYATLPEDWPVFTQRLGMVATWFDRDSLLLLLFASSSAGFVYVVFEKTVTRWLSSRKVHPLTVIHPTKLQSIQLESIKDGKPKECQFIRNYKLAIRNDSKDRRTIRRVQVAFRETGPYGRLRLWGDPKKRMSADLQPGETATFLLGTTDLGRGSSLNLLDNNDERYATTANFRAALEGGELYWASTRIRSDELQRYTKDGVGIMKASLSLVATADETEPLHANYIVHFHIKTAKVTILPMDEESEISFAMSPAPSSS